MKRYFISGYNYIQDIVLEAGTYTFWAYIKSDFGNTFTFALANEANEWEVFDVDVQQGQWTKAYEVFTIKEKKVKLSLIYRYFDASHLVYVLKPQLIKGNIPSDAGSSPFDIDKVTDDLHDAIGGIEDFTNEEFADRVLSSGERVSLRRDLEAVEVIFQSLKGSYEKLLINPFVNVLVLADLTAKYNAVSSAKDQLFTTINTIIAGDNIVTPEEIAAKDLALSSLNNALYAYNTAEKEIANALGEDYTQQISAIRDFTDTEFNDRRLSETEKVSLSHDLDIVQTLLDEITAGYNEIVLNPYLTVADITLLTDKYNALLDAWDAADDPMLPDGLKTVILDIINGDEVITQEEIDEKDLALANFNNKLGEYSTAEVQMSKFTIDHAIEQAAFWSINATSPVIYKDAKDAITDGVHTQVTVKGQLHRGTDIQDGGFITITPNGETEPATAVASPITISPSDNADKSSYTVRLYDTASKTTLLDTLTIPVVFKGASGINAINVVLSNEADVLPASPEGVVSDYSGSGTTIRVFEGATELDYDGIGTANGKFNVTATGTGITVGAKSESGLQCVFGNASNMTLDNAMITFTISGKTQAGTSFSITKTQSFSKARTGQKGDTGASAPLLYLSASAQVMKCNPDNTPQTGQTITFEAKLQNVTGTATFTATPYNDAGVVQTPITLGGGGNIRTLTNSQWLAAYKRVEVIATLGSLTDKVTIYRVADGAKGTDAIVGFLTNESVTLQANSSGVVSSFASASGEFWIYSGTTRITTGITYSKVSETGCTATITSTGVYSVSAMSADNATVVLRAVYNGVTIDKILSLSKSKAGTNGVSITLVDVEFAKNTNPTTPPTTGWSTTSPTLSEGEQLWTRTKTTYSSGSPTYTTPANITPKKGDVGTGVESVTEEYAISTSKTVQPTSGWSTTQPTWVQGQYIWSRVKVVYKNPSSTVYTGYAVSSEWEAVNNLQIGSVNILLNSKRTLSGSAYNIGYFTANRDFVVGETITVTIKGNIPGTKLFGIWFNSGSLGTGSIPKVKDGYYSKQIVVPTGTVTRNVGLYLVGNQSETDSWNFEWIRFDSGNKGSMEWSPAPEDVQAEIDAAQTTADDAQLAAEGYMKARYIRDWIQGSTLSTNNVWREISVIRKDGTNVAQGKTPSSNGTFNASYPAANATDNNINTYAQINGTTPATSNYVQIDLGQVYNDIDYIQIWHDYTDGRTFYGTKTEISVDGVTWTTIYDSATMGTYKETIGGKTHSQRRNRIAAEVNRSKAITDLFGTRVDGGLISTVITEYRELDSPQVTGLISGIQGTNKDLPFLVAGGTYNDALSGTAKAIIRHDGSVKFTHGVFRGVIDADGSNSQKIEWYTGLGTFAGSIQPNSSGHLRIDSSFGIRIESDYDIYLGYEGLNNDIFIGNSSATIKFGGAILDNIKKITNLGFPQMAYTTLSMASNTDYTINTDVSLLVITKAYSSSGILKINADDNGATPTNGMIKIVMNISNSDTWLKCTTSGSNIRYKASNENFFLSGNSLVVLVYYGGYWRPHVDRGQ